MNAKQLARRVAAIVVEKLGDDVVILDLRKQSPLADYFVIASASSAVHARAIADEIAVLLKSEGQRVHHSEGAEGGLWVLLDYFDVVVHIFSGDVRQFYGLERLWGDAPRQTVTGIDEA